MPKKFQLSFVFLRPILCVGLFFYSFFFFQAEDGIRYRNVTGVQTCALPISAILLLLARPSLTQIFGPDVRREHSQLPLRVAAAVHLGYSLVQIGGHLGVHYTTVSRYLRAAQGGRRDVPPPIH